MEIIQIDVNNTRGKILTPLSQGQLSVLQDVCSFDVPGGKYKANAFKYKSHGQCNWDGKKRLFNIQTFEFPIGLLTLIQKTFVCAGFSVQIINSRENAGRKFTYDISGYQERDYQTRAVMSSLMYGNGIVKAATGSGKTTIAARTIAALNQRSIFIVHTRDLLYQTIESFCKMFDGTKIGQIGDGIIDYQPITVATLQTLSILGKIEYEYDKYDEDGTYNDEKTVMITAAQAKQFNQYRKEVGVVMFDEVQRICSRTAYAVRFLFDRASYAFGYSASPWRDDGTDLMIEAAFGPRIVDITASELIRKGFLVRPIINITKLTNNVYSGNNYEAIYKSAIVENAFRNMQIVSDTYNEYKQHKNILVLVTQIKHGETLEKMLCAAGLSATFISGQSRMKKRKQVIQDMRDGKAPVVIASTIADVGLDVPRLDTIVEAGAGKSSVTALQRLGRIMRPFPGKTQCHFITYEDTAPFLWTQIDKKVKIWQTEPEFVIRRN